MPRRKQQDEVVAERAQEITAEQTSRRRPRKAAGTEAGEQPVVAKPARAKKEKTPRAARKPRVHQDLLTVAFRGPLAGHFRELAEQHHLSLSALLQDAMLFWESQVAAGYQPGSARREWKAKQTPEVAQA